MALNRYINLLVVFSLVCCSRTNGIDPNNHFPPGDERYLHVFSTDCSIMDINTYYELDGYDLRKQESDDEVTAKDIIFDVRINGGEIEQDPDIHSLVLQYYQERTIWKEGTIGVPFDIIYKQCFCKGIRIKADKTLFGHESGTDLSEFFTFYAGNFNFFDSYIVTGTRDVVPIVTGMTIQEYLSYNPYALSEAAFVFKKLPEELPIEVTFDFTMIFDDLESLEQSIKVRLR